MDVRNRTDLSLNDPVGESDLQEHLERLTSQHLEENGTELIELQLAGNRNRRMIRIYVDRPGGISIGQCAMLSRGIADLLDTHEPVDGTYTLEVSSPGLNRPIKSERDYKWAVQKQVRLVIQGRDPDVLQRERITGQGQRRSPTHLPWGCSESESPF